MESALVNTLNPGDKVLSVVAGKFGERWAKMAETFGAEVHTLNLEWGKPIQLSQFEAHLKSQPDIKAVLTQACETSTATVFPIKEMALLTKQHTQALFMVDAITAMGCMDLKMDEWGLDVIVAGSQKAFMLPTGLSFIGLSKRAQEASKKNQCKRYYFDWGPELKVHPKSTHFSSPNSLVIALAEVLKMFDEVGMAQVKSRCKVLAQATREGAKDLGLHVFSEAPSDSVTAIQLPQNVDGEKIRSWIETKKNITVMGGQDQLKGQILRVGHMGAIYDDDLLAFFDALMEALNLPEPIDFKNRLSKILFGSMEYF